MDAGSVKHSHIKIANADIHKEYPNIKNGKFIKYHTLLVDPPWSKNQTGNLGAGEHYDLMSMDEIRQLPINELLAENGHLYLWVTNGVLEDAFQLLKDWGLKYRSIFTWVKPRLGLGQYLRIITKSLPTALPEILAKQIRTMALRWYRGMGAPNIPTPRKAHKRGDEAAKAEKAYSVPRNNNAVIPDGAAANCTTTDVTNCKSYDLASCMEERFRRVLIASHESRIRGAPGRRVRTWHIP